ncbi:hypothetical protein ACFQZV_08815 [Microbacterium koreense]|uniref:Uncharacterized protein n=1 Tax=Microbacterium koreense TaxID=323761 RepID=A0ABW2ZRW8_9MICO
MPHPLLFTDALGAADALTFAGRAAALGDGIVRLRADGGVLVMSCAPLAPRGLLDATPTVLGLRVLAVDPELACDLLVDGAALGAVDGDPRALSLPDTARSAAWAGVSPPRGGWAVAGTVAASTLANRAQWGIAAVAEGVPVDAGEDAVRAVRASVWGRPDESLQDMPLGVAFAAFALGFIGGEESAQVRTAGPWTRVSLARGHVLARGPVRSGLTGVRATGGS